MGNKGTNVSTFEYDVYFHKKFNYVALKTFTNVHFSAHTTLVFLVLPEYDDNDDPGII